MSVGGPSGSINIKLLLIVFSFTFQPQQYLEPEGQVSQIAKRKLLMPIISEGYASTNIQGGKRVIKPKIKPSKNRARSTTTPSTTTLRLTTQRYRSTTAPRTRTPIRTRSTPKTRPPTTKTTRKTSTTPKLQYNFEPSNQNTGTVRFPDPDPISYYQDISGPNDAYKQTLNSPSYSVPKQPVKQIYTSPKVPARPITTPLPAKDKPIVKPTVQSQKPAASKPHTIFDPETGKPIKLYTGELITADNNPGGEELVHFSFGNPANNVQTFNTGKEPPQVTYHDPSQEYYKAGYEQIEVPQNKYSNNPTSQYPDQLDPNTFHEDRPSLPANNRQPTTDNFYPLGRPKQPNPPRPSRPINQPGNRRPGPPNNRRKQNLHRQPNRNRNRPNGPGNPAQGTKWQIRSPISNNSSCIRENIFFPIDF